MVPAKARTPAQGDDVTSRSAQPLFQQLLESGLPLLLALDRLHCIVEAPVYAHATKEINGVIAHMPQFKMTVLPVRDLESSHVGDPNNISTQDLPF